MKDKRPLPAAGLARIEEEHRQLAKWLAETGSTRAHASWVEGLSVFAQEARRHRELEEDFIRHFGLAGLKEHQEEHRGVEAAIERLLHEARRHGDRGGPLMACELIASWLGHHQTAWDAVRPKG